MADHKFEKSVAYNSIKGCPKGYHKRSEYTTSAGTYVPARCVRSTSPYEQSSKDFKRSTLRKMKARLERADTRKRSDIHCPKGYIARAYCPKGIRFNLQGIP